jgi:hypothetical protein
MNMKRRLVDGPLGIFGWLYGLVYLIPWLLMYGLARLSRNIIVMLPAVFAASSCQDAPSSKPDPRAREWILPAGETVRFSHEDPGFWRSDHAKYLDVRFNDGQTRRYSFAESHSGYNRVELRMNAAESQIWLIDCDNGQLGAFLDLSTRRFKGEGQGPPLPADTLFLKSQ